MRGFNDHAMLARMLELLAWAAADGGTHERAARVLGAADVLWRDAGSSITAFGPQLAEQHTRCERSLVDALDEAPYAKAFAEGGTHSTPCQAVGFALATADTDGGTEPDNSALSAPGEPDTRGQAVTDRRPGTAGVLRFGDLGTGSASTSPPPS
ncbi:hypothetical protein AB0945_26440 [Streptomyces sp. NPDC005474]|uniref:hypothetical protein n=1 Tax=Streptomyces sp. NPDC005474 TaxID=3154878 RepID=UPI0034572572